MIGDLYISNGVLKDVEVLKAPLHENSIVIYEVFTWYNGNAIFFEEHYSRMLDSVHLKNLNTVGIPSVGQVKRDISRLADANSFTKKNIRFDLEFVEGKLMNYLLYFVKSTYPDEKLRDSGVEVGLCFGERKDPNAKVANSEIREKANKKINDFGFFEVLLVDENNNITEGSRSNVFFVKDKTIFTSKEEKVLNGITRQKVFEIAKENSFKIIEADVNLNDLPSFDSAFLTSTSMSVLPIARVEDVHFKVDNEVVKKLYFSFLGLN